MSLMEQVYHIVDGDAKSIKLKESIGGSLAKFDTSILLLLYPHALLQHDETGFHQSTKKAAHDVHCSVSNEDKEIRKMTRIYSAVLAMTCHKNRNTTRHTDS